MSHYTDSELLQLMLDFIRIGGRKLGQAKERHELVRLARERLLHGEARIDMILHCPVCHVQHIDRPDPLPRAWEPQERWLNPPHKTHLCLKSDGGCGHLWKPANVPTNGVASLEPPENTAV